jgi:ribose/xylose/arabinose/galactoside ABC-type transport system permease subunit
MTKLNSQKGGCVSSILIIILALVLGSIIGFLSGIYYQKNSDSQKQTKENFNSLSKGGIAGISIGAVVVVIILCILYIIYYYYNLFGQIVNRLSR